MSGESGSDLGAVDRRANFLPRRSRISRMTPCHVDAVESVEVPELGRVDLTPM